ncbi:MAG: phosphoribosylglycinamide formyltransferase [Acidobacteria bacterium]|nr:phosphoribosylglycinamide formyltransferase [Acidobacteriota bacterium]
MRRERLGVLISGRGSNLRAMLDATRSGELRAAIEVVVSNVPGAPGLVTAAAAGITTVVLPHREYAERDAYDRALGDVLRRHDVGLVCLAGFMRLLGPAFCAAFPLGVVNIHPSLLPAFPGVNAQRQALEHGVKVSGATVHLVNAGLDAGPIVAQQAVPVLDDDSVESLSARILAAEHTLYPATIDRLVHDRWQVVGRRVVFERPENTVR